MKREVAGEEGGGVDRLGKIFALYYEKLSPITISS